MISNAPPNNPDAEHSLLGAFLFNPRFIGSFLDSVRDEHFWNSGCRLLWQQLRADFIARREITLPVVSGRMVESGLWQAMQGTMSAVLEHLNPTIEAVLVETIAILERMRVLREARESVLSVQSAIDEMKVDDMRSASMRLIERISETKIATGHSIKEIYGEVVNETGDPTTIGIKTGLDWLDGKTGGLTPGSLEITAAPRGGGKSALATQRAWATVGLGHFVSFFSLEMTRREIFQRICCIEGVSSDSWMHRRFNRSELETIRRVGEMKDAPMRIYDDLYKLEDISARIRLDAARFNMRLAVVDYIQRVKGDKSEGREREVSGVAWELKQLALTLGITIIAPSQLNGDLQARESRDIENHADKMLIIARGQKDDEEDNGRRLIKITKNRNGPSDCRCVYQFAGEHFRFHEVEETQADIRPARQWNDR